MSFVLLDCTSFVLLKHSQQLVTPHQDQNMSQTNAVAVKLPTFSVSESLIWFRRAEAQFRLRQITNSITKADHVVQALPDEVFTRLSSWFADQGDERVSKPNYSLCTRRQQPNALAEYSPCPVNRSATEALNRSSMR